ncbi:hypothetical protein AC249_AIPGENE12630 [Exaiptasia diaphana]|nr:hypothetical protein AC249_AIPGENE12630 [Exaiptasia diaphana]
MRINNTLDKEVELVSNDGHPPGGVLLKPKQALVLRKEISVSVSVVFTAQDVSTGSGLLLNDGEEYVATPSEYKQQLTSIDITDAECVDKPAPRDRYYATLILKNKYKSTAVIISNDNHPSDGYRIGSGSQETLSKEVLTPGKIDVRAFDPTTGKPLLVNGQESYSITPSREKRNPDALEITSQVVPNAWFYLLVMWNRNDGLSMYMDNQLKASTRDGRPNPVERLPTTEQTNLNVGRNINGQSAPHNAHFLMSSLVMFNRNIPTQSVPSITKYFSKPIAVHPLTKYYIMLKITNPTQNDIILQPSDKYPAGGFTISKKAIAKVKKEVSSPSEVSFIAQIKGQANKYILLNGKPRIKVSPSESPLEVFDVNFSPKGKIR